MKKLCLHDISTYTNFHQKRSINECARMILAKKGLIRPWMTFEVVLHLMKICVIVMLTLLKKFLKD